MPKSQRALFLFHRDLRLHDNTALIEAHLNAETVIPTFIFDHAQTAPHPYQSTPGLQFLIESLEDLNRELTERSSALQVFRGYTLEILEALIAAKKVDAVYSNRDYTPFARNRDEQIQALCRNYGIRCEVRGDSLLHEPEEILKSDRSPYTVYTPYAKRAAQNRPRVPVKNAYSNFSSLPEALPLERVANEILPNEQRREYAVRGGRSVCKKILSKAKSFKDYAVRRDLPALDATSKLSAHHKFGTCSVREVFYTIAREFGEDHTFIKELYWRDFFSQIAYHSPRVFKGSFHQRYDAIKWINNKEWFDRWCAAITGFPIVDAGMRELNQSGFMHNRVRMITASFLVKDLHVDWRWGEQYFAKKLIDYDPAVNNGNWQWVASTGCDAQPYFRIFNPWLQQEKFDPECEYIKRWIPELSGATPQEIHGAAKGSLAKFGYPSPMVEHKEEKLITEELYSIVSSKRAN